MWSSKVLKTKFALTNSTKSFRGVIKSICALSKVVLKKKQYLPFLVNIRFKVVLSYPANLKKVV